MRIGLAAVAPRQAAEKAGVVVTSRTVNAPQVIAVLDDGEYRPTYLPSDQACGFHLVDGSEASLRARRSRGSTHMCSQSSRGQCTTSSTRAEQDSARPQVSAHFSYARLFLRKRLPVGSRPSSDHWCRRRAAQTTTSGKQLLHGSRGHLISGRASSTTLAACLRTQAQHSSPPQHGILA
eukprot:CAMPEP_0175419832 /NCGR_PEP_ID=MMETSP0095-20121207/46431_1 /TAXON_ID=311494 /ORGANISM="Alexandrium monilatum, Strain CCMP3105" /LENGTH=178 /DNA_ID=CAMNT_0016719033 /DNA_START=273 /DNA_END=806 /DNA_ORIENTATION=+